jgi:hypothetical protein
VALPAGELFFYTSSIGRGLSFLDQTSNLLFDLLGDVIYTNGEAAPHFATGLFSLPLDNVGGTDIHATLTVAAVAATPIPAALSRSSPRHLVALASSAGGARRHLPHNPI